MIIKEGASDLEIAKSKLKITDELMDEWEREQLVFFATLGDEAPYDLREVMYVELLQKLPFVDERSQRALDAFVVGQNLDIQFSMLAFFRTLAREDRGMKRTRRIAYAFRSLHPRLA